MNANPSEIRLVVFDWAGTTVDHGCFAPVAPVVGAFAARGVEVTVAEARGPMGLHKKDHIRELLKMPTVADNWRSAVGRDWTEDDVEALFRAFIPLQMDVIDRHCELVPGLLETVAELKRRNVKIGATTGYFRASAERVVAAAAMQGYRPDVALNPEDVPAGRPAPWMVFRIMRETGVYPPAAVVKIGDTVPDIEEGRNAGAWAIGVTHTGSEVGLTAADWARLPAADKQTRADAAKRKLLAAGAHAAIDSVASVPKLLDRLAERLRAGEKP